MVFYIVGKMNSVNLFQRLILPNCLIKNFSRAPSLFHSSNKDGGDDESKKDGGKRNRFAKFFEDTSVDESSEPKESELKPKVKLDESSTLNIKSDSQLKYKAEAKTILGREEETGWKPDDEVVSRFDSEGDTHKDEQIFDKDHSKLGTFASAFEKFSKIGSEPEPEPEKKPEPEEEQQTFAALLKNSKFMDLGDPVGKVVLGDVYHVVGDDLYIDFGWKFPTICQRPAKGGEDYRRGTKVRLLIKDLELSTKFLGSTTDTTLNEADCILLGLAQKR